MAKRGADDFSLDDIDSDEASEDFSGSAPKPAGKLAVPAPLKNAIGGAREFFENTSASIQGAFGDKDRPMLPIALLGGAILVILLLIIVIASSLSNAASAKPVTHTQAANAMDGNPKTADPSDQTEQGSRPLVNHDFALNDSFLSKPILPNEPNFMLQGEIQYQRPQKDYWDLRDIKPGWQNLDKLNRTMLREKNSEDFHRLIGETPPPRDRY